MYRKIAFMIFLAFSMAVVFLSAPEVSAGGCWSCYASGRNYTYSGWGATRKQATRKAIQICKQAEPRHACSRTWCESQPTGFGCGADNGSPPDGNFSYCNLNPTAAVCLDNGSFCERNPFDRACGGVGGYPGDYCSTHPGDPLCAP